MGHLFFLIILIFGKGSIKEIETFVLIVKSTRSLRGNLEVGSKLLPYIT
jgi:hypothetical protein